MIIDICRHSCRMGCNNTKVESSTRHDHTVVNNNNNVHSKVPQQKSAIQSGDCGDATDVDRDMRISEMFVAAEQNATLILEQLKENDVLSFSVVRNGGVAFNATMDGNIKKSNNNGPSTLPPNLLDRLQSRVKDEYDSDERNIIADVIKAEEARMHAERSRLLTKRQQQAKIRRDEIENNMKEKVNKKMQYIEEVYQRKESANRARSRMSTPSLHAIDR